MNKLRNKKIWVIGASLGIGASLVKHLHKQGAELAISSRSDNALSTLAETLNADVMVLPLDVTEVNSIANQAEILIAKWQEIDSIIYLPAIYHPSKLTELDLRAVKQQLDTNIMAVFNAISIIVPILKKQKYGQFAICSSIAGFMGMPNGQPYSATKAAVTNIVETLKCELPYLDIKVVHPGFVKTRLTEKNAFKMPMIITPDAAANYIGKCLQRRKFEIAFPGRFVLLAKILRMLPYFLYFKLFSSHSRIKKNR